MDYTPSKEEKIKIVTNIQKEMIKRGYSKSDLASNLGWSPSKITKIFSVTDSGQKISLDDLMCIGHELQCNPAVFLLGEDELTIRAEGKSIWSIFSMPKLGNLERSAFVKKLQTELPETMRFYIREENEQVEVTAKIKRKGNADEPWQGFAPNTLPRVVINDTSAGSLYGKDISLGYWFTDDLSGVYLAINYNNDESTPANEYESRKVILERAKTFRVLIDEPEQRSHYHRLFRDGEPKKQRYEDGMIKAKFYSFENLPFEDELKADLLEYYETYKKLLEMCVKRVKRNYLAHGGPVNQDDLVEAQSILRDVQEMEQKILVRRGPQRSYHNALEREQYRCEIDSSHMTFSTGKTGKPYMEATHLIPVSKQDEFNNSLRVEANVCCLCPTCSAKLAYGENVERQEMIMKLYFKHKDMLAESGIEITPIQLLNLRGIS